jgi:hypothetical protein
MDAIESKPLNWNSSPELGYSVSRRPDGGMRVVFTDLNRATLEHWRSFSLEHLLDSDRLTRNLYDLRQIEKIPDLAIQYAIEVNSDPSVRNIRLAVVVASEQVREAILDIAALTPGGVELAVFTEVDKAEAWLDRPLTLVV